MSILHPHNRTNAKVKKLYENAPLNLSPMFEIEVIVTKSTRTELRLTADWPRAWRQNLGYIEIERILFPGEMIQPLNTSVERSEIPVDRRILWNLQLGDRALVRCFLKGESLQMAPALPDDTPGERDRLLGGF